MKCLTLLRTQNIWNKFPYIIFARNIPLWNLLLKTILPPFTIYIETCNNSNYVHHQYQKSILGIKYMRGEVLHEDKSLFLSFDSQG